MIRDEATPNHVWFAALGYGDRLIAHGAKLSLLRHNVERAFPDGK